MPIKARDNAPGNRVAFPDSCGFGSEITLYTARESVDESMAKVMDFLKRNGLIPLTDRCGLGEQ